MKKNSDHTRRLRRLTLSAMLIALSVVLLYLGTLLDVLSLSAVALSSFLMFLAVRELPFGYRLAVYFGTSLLSALLLPYPEAAVLYVMFGGFYPLVKLPLERLRRPLPLLFKLLYFNAVITLSELCSVLLFGLPASAWYILALLYLVANPVFFLYDRVVDRLLVYYEARLRPRFAHYFK